MSARFLLFVLEAVSIFIFVVTPFLLVWGWIRWARCEKRWTVLPMLSFAGFTLSTASALLAVASAIYGHFIGGFPYYDPRLLKIYFWGLIVSLAALLLGLTGVWRPSALRWHALICAFGTLVYWFAMIETE
jgi:hypothetical protein